MKRKLIFLIFLLSMSSWTKAKVVLPDLFSDNMVLQQSTWVKIWGKAKANASVYFKCSWNSRTSVTKSDGNGDWTIKVKTPSASYTPQYLTLSDGSGTTKVRNILIGEVWMCSGQSNMEITMNGYWNCPIAHANEVIAESGQYKGIRCLMVYKKGAFTPQQSCSGKWKESNSRNTPGFSATAYNFAVELNKILNVPVGILVCSWGGSTVEGWLPEKVLKEYADIDLSKISDNDATEYLKPEIMYNGMLHPIEGYTIRGFIWYQGESNVDRYGNYADRFATMVKTWRSEWGQGELPFYYVEIAPFQYGKGDKGAYLREAQFKASEMIPNSGIVCTNDLVEPYEQNNIHPKDKEDIGKRLCYLALTKTYKMDGIESDSPSYRSMEIKGNKAILYFNHVQDGFNRMNDMQGFEIAGSDRIFYPAIGKVVDNHQIEVSSSEVSQPVAVRYCFHNFQIGNVKNTRDLPLFPFRTDRW